MSERKKKSPSEWKEHAPNSPSLERKTYEDVNGIPKTVLLPQGETDAKAGIPLSLDLTPLYNHMPTEFQRELYKALHAQGLIEPKDYFAPGAADRYQRAIRTVIKHDFLDCQTLANDELKHRR